MKGMNECADVDLVCVSYQQLRYLAVFALLIYLVLPVPVPRLALLELWRSVPGLCQDLWNN